MKEYWIWSPRKEYVLKPDAGGIEGLCFESFGHSGDVLRVMRRVGDSQTMEEIGVIECTESHIALSLIDESSSTVYFYEKGDEATWLDGGLIVMLSKLG